MLEVLALIYGAASLLHFVHNGMFVEDYPNLPAWIAASGVYATWVGITSVGILGYWLYRSVSRMRGLAVLAFYAVLGFGGLDHYLVAPIAAHSIMMNVTILFEAVSAAALLGCVTIMIAREVDARPR